jgi:sugar lactone lactonase YvrE
MRRIPDVPIFILCVLFGLQARSLYAQSQPDHQYQLALGNGYYTAAITLAPGQREGAWGMQVTPSAYVLSGGFNLGGAFDSAGASSIGFAGFNLDSAQSVSINLNAQALPGSAGPVVSVNILNSARKQVSSTYSGPPPIQFGVYLQPGFYIVQISSLAGRGTYQLSLGADLFTGGVDVGGFITQGVTGFGGFDLPIGQNVTIQLYSFAYGSAGAGNLSAELLNESQQVVWTPSVVLTVAGNGSSIFSGDGGPANLAALNPEGVTVDSSGNLFIADNLNNRIRKVTPAGIITTIAGNGSSGFSGDGGSATSASLSGPNSVVVDQSGNLFISDNLNNRIRKVTPAGIITTVAGNGSSGWSGDGGPATSASLSGPNGVVVDQSGNLFIADLGNLRIRKVTSTGIITTVAGNGTYGYSGDGGPASSAALRSPTGVAVDAGGNLFIADTGNNRIREVTSAGIITTVAGNGSGAFSGDGGPATLAGLDPAGVTVDAGGNLFIADAGNNRIRKVTPAGIISTVAGDGSMGFRGDGGPALSAGLNAAGVTVDAGGNLFIVDTGNNRIRKIMIPAP